MDKQLRGSDDQRSHEMCAANQTGIIRITQDSDKYDAFCYDAKGLYNML